MITKKNEIINEMKVIYTELSFHREAYDLKENNPSFGIFPDENFLLMMEIESFVISVMHDIRPLFREEMSVLNQLIIFTNPLGFDFLNLYKQLKYYVVVNVNSLSVYVRLFLSQLNNTILLSKSNYFLTEVEQISSFEVTHYNCFLRDLRLALTTSEVKGELNKQNSRVSKRYKDASSYIDKKLSQCPDVALFSLQFCFHGALRKWENFPFQEIINIDDYISSFTRFFRRNRTDHPLKGALVGYVGKWDFTPKKGLYAQVLFLVDAKKVDVNDKLLHDIGKYWEVQACKGQGGFHCDYLASSRSIFNRQIFLIDSKDTKQRKELKETILKYLAKSSMYYKSHYLPTNTFFRGEIVNKKSKTKDNSSVEDPTNDLLDQPVTIDKCD